MSIIRKLSLQSLNRPIKSYKSKINKSQYHLEKLLKPYIDENLNRHTVIINEMINKSEKNIIQSIDKKINNEFWKIYINLNGWI
jgi:hypothetical protein